MHSLNLARYLQHRADGDTVERASELSGIGLGEAKLHEKDIERGELVLPLTKLGLVEPVNVFAEHEKDRLRRDYELFANRGRLHVLAAQMGRTKQFLCRQAGELGLTDANRSKACLAPQMSKRAKQWHAKNPHPRGMLGKKHSESTKDVFSQLSFDRWNALSEDERIAIAEKAKTTWKAGWREIGGYRKFYRSKWEANYARYLEWLRARGEITAWDASIAASARGEQVSRRQRRGREALLDHAARALRRAGRRVWLHVRSVPVPAS
jgi:hypothetical protein